MNQEDGHSNVQFVVYKEKVVNCKVSARDLIVLIKFACVEACKGVEEPRGSRQDKQTSPPQGLHLLFLRWCMLVSYMNLSVDVGRSNWRYSIEFVNHLW